MKARFLLPALALLLTSCGTSGRRPTPTLAQVPLLPGARVVAQAEKCDQGRAAYCALEFVVEDRAFTHNEDFLLAERHWLHAHGWTGAHGDTGQESAADSPGHKLHLGYATADGDLQGWAFNWIKRRSAVIYALSDSVFEGTAALSMLLEPGPSAS